MLEHQEAGELRAKIDIILQSSQALEPNLAMREIKALADLRKDKIRLS